MIDAHIAGTIQLVSCILNGDKVKLDLLKRLTVLGNATIHGGLYSTADILSHDILRPVDEASLD